MKPEHLLPLSNVLWVQLSAVQQHFMHVLTLQVWERMDLARRIADVDAIDLPNALRIVDRIVQDGQLPAIDDGVVSKEARLPALGTTLDEVFRTELSLDRSLEAVLRDAGAEYARIHASVSPLILTPLNARAGYQSWLRRNIEKCKAGSDECSTDKHLTLPEVGALFAVLSQFINQSIIHCFVHWHAGDRSMADRTWFASGIAMMQVAKLTKRLAALHRTAGSMVRLEYGDAPCTRLALTPAAAAANDLAMMRASQDKATACRTVVTDEQLKGVCEETIGYFGQIETDLGNVFETDIQNPCSGFDRVYETYVNVPGAMQRPA